MTLNSNFPEQTVKAVFPYLPQPLVLTNMLIGFEKTTPEFSILCEMKGFKPTLSPNRSLLESRSADNAFFLFKVRSWPKCESISFKKTMSETSFDLDFKDT